MENAQKKYTVDMTQGGIFRHIIMFALPIFLSQLFQQAYNTVDALVVGKYIGTNAIAASTSTSSLIYLLVSFNTGLAAGAGVVIGKYFGAKDNERVSSAIHTIILFGLIWGVVLSVFGVVMTPKILVWMHSDPEVLPLSVDYLRYYFMGGITIVLYNICTGIMNALGDSKDPLKFLIISSVINIVLDLVFVGLFKWGIWSAAFATVISQVISVILCFIFLCKKGHIYTVELKKLKLDVKLFIEIIKNGVPSGVQNSVIGFANVIIQSQINTFGAIAMAAYGIHGKIQGFAFLPITSFTLASTTFISQNLGAKEYDRAKRGAKYSILAACLIAMGIGFIYCAFSPFFIKLYDKTPEVLALATKQARIESLFYFFLAFSHSIAAVCRGAGKPTVPMIVMLAIWCVLRVAYIAMIMKFIGEIQYVYTAYPLTWTLSSIIFFIYYKKSDWIHGLDNKKVNTGV